MYRSLCFSLTSSGEALLTGCGHVESYCLIHIPCCPCRYDDELRTAVENHEEIPYGSEVRSMCMFFAQVRLQNDGSHTLHVALLVPLFRFDLALCWTSRPRWRFVPQRSKQLSDYVSPLHLPAWRPSPLSSLTGVFGKCRKRLCWPAKHQHTRRLGAAEAVLLPKQERGKVQVQLLVPAPVAVPVLAQVRGLPRRWMVVSNPRLLLLMSRGCRHFIVL